MGDGFLGEIRMFAGSYAPQGWAICDGGTIPVAHSPELAELISGKFGSADPGSFRLPDLRGRIVVGTGNVDAGRVRHFPVGATGGREKVQLTIEELPRHTHRVSAAPERTTNDPRGKVWAPPSGDGGYAKAPTPGEHLHQDSIGSAGESSAHDNMMPYLPLNYIIALKGHNPRSSRGPDPMLAQVALFAYPIAPEDAAGRFWIPCDGRPLPIAEHQALFAIMGTTFGGDGVRTFRVPDLRGRVPICGSDDLKVGTAGGEQEHALTLDEIPHTHPAYAAEPLGIPSLPRPNRTWGGPKGGFGDPGALTMSQGALSTAGVDGPKPHENMQPYMALAYHIAILGIFPRRP